MEIEVMVKGWVVVLAVGFPQGRDGLATAPPALGRITEFRIARRG